MMDDENQKKMKNGPNFGPFLTLMCKLSRVYKSKDSAIT